MQLGRTAAPAPGGGGGRVRERRDRPGRGAVSQESPVPVTTGSRCSAGYRANPSRERALAVPAGGRANQFSNWPSAPTRLAEALPTYIVTGSRGSVKSTSPGTGLPAVAPPRCRGLPRGPPPPSTGTQIAHPRFCRLFGRVPPVSNFLFRTLPFGDSFGLRADRRASGGPAGGRSDARRVVFRSLAPAGAPGWAGRELTRRGDVLDELTRRLASRAPAGDLPFVASPAAAAGAGGCTGRELSRRSDGLDEITRHLASGAPAGDPFLVALSSCRLPLPRHLLRTRRVPTTYLYVRTSYRDPARDPPARGPSGRNFSACRTSAERMNASPALSAVIGIFFLLTQYSKVLKACRHVPGCWRVGERTSGGRPF